MGNPTRKDGRIEPGQKLGTAISARAWNRAQEAADIVLGERTRFGADGQSAIERASNIVLVRNDSGADIPRFGVIGFGQIISNLNTSQIVVQGVLPKAFSAFGIAVEPIASGSVGRCACSGVFPVRVSICNTSHMYANPKDNDVEMLYSSTVGSLQILSRGNFFFTGEDIVVGVM
jgi:hypothetical protein